LLDAIYLQFAYAIDGNKRQRQCQVCRRWFELSPGINRADRLTCSDSCRVRQTQERRTRARQLRAEGKTAKQIAREIGSKVDKVKEWLANQKG
jgi:hypothetical protein